MKKLVMTLLSALFSLSLLAQTDEGVAYFRQTETEPADSAEVLPTDTLPFPANIRQRLDTLLTDPMLKTSQVGLMVYDLTADSCIYAYNHQQTMRPASTQKLVTAIAAIDRLGGSYQLRTSLYYSGTIVGRTLVGDIICQGGMDPAFGHDDLTAFVEGLRRLGVDSVRGHIVADRSFKDADLLGEGWCWDDDNPVLSPLLLNRKDDLMLRFVQALRDDGVVVEAPVTEGRLPNGAQKVCTRTHTIDQILSKMMKDSDNLYAEAMFYQTGAAGGTRPAKAAHARQYIQRLIQKVGLTPARYKIADGSGLSLYNYLSPELHVRLLRYAYRNPNILEHLLPALPIAGQDGTLRNRMRGTAAAGNVRAKTGTVTCVSCLAGYCTAAVVQPADGHELCFAIMNQGVMTISQARAFQDRVCRALCEPRDALSAKPPVARVAQTAVRPASQRASAGSKGRAAAKKSKKKKRR